MTSLLLLAVPAPAWADDDGWLSPNCATGQITDHTVQWSPAGDYIIQVDGWSARCGLAQSPDVYQFGLILYSETGAWVARLSEYGPGSTLFSYQVNHTTERRFGDPVNAICLAYDYHDRLSCIGVNMIGPNDPPTTAYIDVDDDRVRERPVQGLCATCAFVPPPTEAGRPVSDTRPVPRSSVSW